MDAPPAASPLAALKARLRAMFGGSNEASLTNRLAGTIFLIRVVSAAMAYFAQILLARWMGGSDYGVYVYVWTWVLLLGSHAGFRHLGVGAEDHSGISRQRRPCACCAASCPAAAG